MKTFLAAGAVALALSSSAASAAPADPMVGLFAQNAAISNAFELAEAKIVLEDSTNPALRAFAAHMMHDHTLAQDHLAQAGRMAGVPTAFVLDSVHQKEVDDIGLMDGATLDRTYVADQVAAHASAAATLAQYAANGSDPALRTYARQTLPVVIEHQRMLAALLNPPQVM
jgi:putative membrane protein